jgi:hypothetical protein
MAVCIVDTDANSIKDSPAVIDGVEAALRFTAIRD